MNTHGCRLSEGKVAPIFAEAEGWMPPDQTAFYSWAQVPDLASDFVDGKISSYFPVYEVNPA